MSILNGNSSNTNITATPTMSPSAFNRSSYLTPDELNQIHGFAGVKRNPQGNYGGFDSGYVKSFQQLYNNLTPNNPIEIDGIHGDQTAAAAYDLLSRYGNGGTAATNEAPTYNPTQYEPYNPSGSNPVWDIINQFKPQQKPQDTERMRKAAGWSALSALLRNFVDAKYAPEGASIVQHTDPEWAMKLANRYEQLKDRDKNDTMRYNSMRLNQSLRDKATQDAYNEKMNDRNYAENLFANRTNYDSANKEYWYGRQKADKDKDYNRSRADQLDMFNRQFEKQKEMARLNESLQEGAWQRRMKYLRDNNITSNGKSASSNGGSGKPFMTYYDSASGKNMPLTDGQAMDVLNSVYYNGIMDKDDIAAYKQSLIGAGNTNEIKRMVQRYMPRYKQQGATTQVPTQQGALPNLIMRQNPNTMPQMPTQAPTQRGNVMPNFAPHIPKTVELLMSKGYNQQDAMSEYDQLSSQGYSDDDVYNYLSE